MNDKRDFLLSEMSLGPLWKLRHDAPVSEQNTPAIEAEMADSVATSAATITTLQDEGETAAFALFLNTPEYSEAAETAPAAKSAHEPDFPPEVTAVDLASAAAIEDLSAGAVAVEKAALDLAWNATAASENNSASVVSSTRDFELTESAACLCGLSDKAEQALFRADRAKPDYLFVYCDAAGGARRHQAADSAKTLFENMLLAMDVQRGAKAYLSNVLISAPQLPPGKDVTALAAEYSVCLPCLRRQLKLMQPSVIVALGSTVAGTLLNSDPAAVTALRGSLQHFEGLPLVLSDDPRYLLSHPLGKAKVWSDLCLAMNSLVGS
ncbi:uracil-DNA glycosylase family protein [Undibacterium sp. Ren11W]|uniref:uracil-DNA glycosylase family protein n=1 Tax=Undibacterium sp. Ren11W TaxID=3413045 RepID=UPI003BEFF84E